MPAGTEAGGAMPGPTAGAQVAATPWRAGEKRLATTRAVNAAATTACFIRLQYRSVRGSVAAGQAASGTNGLPGGTKNGVAAARPTAMRDAPGMATSHDRGADPSEPRRSPLLRELVLAAALFLLADAAVAATQPLIDVADGKGWDGASYYTVAQQLASGERPTEEAPFVYRLGTPFLAATISPNDLIAGFVVVNAAANALTAMLFFLWLRPFIPDLRIRLALLAAFVLMWHGPIHFFHFYPVSAEHLTYAINLLGLFGAYALRERISVRLVGALALLAVVGAAVRETALLAPAALPFARNPLRLARRLPSAPIPLFLPLAAGALALVLVHRPGAPTDDFGFARAIVVWFTEKSPLVYVLGWWTAYGPLLALPVIGWGRSLAVPGSHQLLSAFLAVCAVLWWIGGQGTQRYAFLAG